jgi:hypothetical protein
MDARENFGGAGHLRHPTGRDEAAGFDAFQADIGERLDELDFDIDRKGGGLVLQAVARRDLDDADGLGVSNQSLPGGAQLLASIRFVDDLDARDVRIILDGNEGQQELALRIGLQIFEGLDDFGAGRRLLEHVEILQ